MNKNLIWILVFLLLVTPIYAMGSENYQMVLTTPDTGGKESTSSNYNHNSAIGTTTGTTESTNHITSLGIWFGGVIRRAVAIAEGWKVALIANLSLIAFGFFYVSKKFDKKEHPLFKLFLFFAGVFIGLIGLSVTTQIAIASTDSVINNVTNLNTAYWIFIMLIFVSLMYWMIYFLKQGLNMYRFKKQKEIEG